MSAAPLPLPLPVEEEEEEDEEDAMEATTAATSAVLLYSSVLVALHL
jgi:hypothetical protein